MDKRLLAGIVMVFGLLLSSCAAKTEQPSATELPTETEVVATSAPEAGECLACHTDKQQLIDTAKPIVETGEAESSGVG